MALTQQEKNSVVEFLDNMDRSAIQKALASMQAFTNWLQGTFYSLYQKTRDTLANLFGWLSDILMSK